MMSEPDTSTVDDHNDQPTQTLNDREKRHLNRNKNRRDNTMQFQYPQPNENEMEIDSEKNNNDNRHMNEDENGNDSNDDNSNNNKNKKKNDDDDDSDDDDSNDDNSNNNKNNNNGNASVNQDENNNLEQNEENANDENNQNPGLSNNNNNRLIDDDQHPSVQFNYVPPVFMQPVPQEIEMPLDRNVRRRIATSITPRDNQLRRSNMLTRTNEVTIEQLLAEDPSTVPRNTRINLQLMRVIANSNTGNNLGPARVYGAARNNRNQSSNVNYSRLFLFRVVSADEGNVLVYLMESKNSNNNLWKRNPAYRDNGVITIGTIVTLLSPAPIRSMMANDIPMLESRFPVIVMKDPEEFDIIRVNEGIPENESKAFVLSNCEISVISSIPEETRCSGLFCDKQRVHEIMERSQGCGCYSMLSRRSNMVMDHSLQIEHRNSGWNCFVEKFSSNKFSELYLSGSFPSNLRADALQMTDEYWNMTDKIAQIVEEINNNGGWTVIGWYKRGLINDQSMVSEEASNIRNNNQNENQVANGLINYHICVLRPSNDGYFRPYNNLRTRLYELKYQMTNLQGISNAE